MSMPTNNQFQITRISRSHEIKCTMVQINDINILFNCGSTKELEINYEIPKIDIVFLSHAGIDYSGGLVKLMSSELNKNAPIYSTVPVKHLSKLCIHEIDSSSNFFYKKQKCDPLKLDLLDNIKTIKYHEPITISNIIITAYNSGHSIGGTVWRLQVGPDNLYVGYSINFSGENHINGFTQEIKPHSIFLTDSGYMTQSQNILNQNITNLNQRDANLKQILEEYKDYKIIIPTDYLRLIELLFVLNDPGVRYLKINVIGSFTKTFEEYMPLFLEYSGSIAFNLLTSHRENPFICPNVKFTNKIDEDSNVFIPIGVEFLKILLLKYNDTRNLLLIQGHITNVVDTKINKKNEQININDVLKKHLDLAEATTSLQIFDIKYPNVAITQKDSSTKEESSNAEEEIFEEETPHILVSTPINEDSEEDFKLPITTQIKNINFLKKSIQTDFIAAETIEIPKPEENIEIVAKTHNFNFKQTVKFFDFSGTSTINEFYKNMNNNKYQKLIFETDNANEIAFLTNLFKNQNIVTLSVPALVFYSEYSFSEVALSEDVFDDISLQQYGCLQLGGVVLAEDRCLKLSNNISRRILANLDVKLMQKRLKENEINSEVLNNLIIIENNIEMEISAGFLRVTIKIFNEMVLRVKEVLKEFMVFL